MLRFLLDEHLSPSIVSAIHVAQIAIDIISMYDWENGTYIGVDDRVILAAAHEQGLTLVTYDQKTIAPLLVQWGQRDISHAGVVFGSIHTIPTNAIGALARALTYVWQTCGDLDWTNQVAYLERSPDESR